LFTRTTDLLRRLQQARQALTLASAIEKFDKYHVLILDDLCYVRKDQAETSVLFELIATRYERRSLIVTANNPFGEWTSVVATNNLLYTPAFRWRQPEPCFLFVGSGAVGKSLWRPLFEARDLEGADALRKDRLPGAPQGFQVDCGCFFAEHDDPDTPQTIRFG
jgi:hypothetical protein